MFRNREIRRFALIFALITVAGTAGGWLIHPAAGLLSLVTAAAFGILLFAFTRDRYRRLARMSQQIDRVLHREDHLDFLEMEEGELSILQSEITKMTQRIREQNEALKREKGHLADSMADIAHQLRTPLTSINLMVSLLEKETDETQRRRLLREMEELLMRMDLLITSLLKLSRLDAGIVVFEQGIVDVKDLLHAAIRPFLISMELHEISLLMEVPEEVEIIGDHQWLSEAVQNLLKNSIECAGDHGRIEIVCEDTLLYVEIRIHDSGPGFEREDISRIFDRFYRGKQAGTSGYGIGLALSKSIIKRQGGTITAGNHPQGGAVFSIRFPK